MGSLLDNVGAPVAAHKPVEGVATHTSNLGRLYPEIRRTHIFTKPLFSEPAIRFRLAFDFDIFVFFGIPTHGSRALT